MANYVVTSNKLDAVKDSLKATDKVVILYKDSDTVTFQQMLNLMGSKAQKEFLSYENDNELLIRIGYLAASGDKLVSLDPDISIPGWLCGDAKESKPRRKRKGTVKDAAPAKEPKKRGRKPSNKTKEEKPATKTSGELKGDTKEARLQKILGITANDIGYSFGTEFMMGRIISHVNDAKTDGDLRSALEFNFRSDKKHLVADTVLKHVDEVRKIASE